MSPRWYRLLAAGVATATIFSGLAVGAGSTALAAGTGRAAPSAANPVVTGPVTGGNGAIVLPGTTTFALSSVGYTQSEFFISGQASSFTPAAPLGSDGQWQVTPATSAPYTTRMVVYRPANPARFNGSVVVEWLNVSAGVDAAAEWIYSHTELIREGFAVVEVSAQALGMNQAKAADPVRYAALSHPGDSYSYDIFSQAGQAVRDEAPLVLGGLVPRRVLAEGESQSAGRLVTYIDAIQPLVHEYDGFFVHSRSAAGAPLSQPPQATVLTPAVVFFRPDLGVPVLALETETDLLRLGFLPAQQADSPGFRLWELAGTAHADNYETNLGLADNGTAGPAEFQAMQNPPVGAAGGTCPVPVNTGEEHYLLDAGQFWLNRWVATGQAPPAPPLLKVDTSGATPVFVTDANGNAEGGVRTPAVDVPVATLSGLGQTALNCILFGTTVPFSAARLAALYPTHAQFVAEWAADTIAGVRAGFIRPADARELISAAARSDIGA